MSLRTLPLVFVNLGGEMLYILNQRLRAHNTSEDNSEKGIGNIQASFASMCACVSVFYFIVLCNKGLLPFFFAVMQAFGQKMTEEEVSVPYIS